MVSAAILFVSFSGGGHSRVCPAATNNEMLLGIFHVNSRITLFISHLEPSFSLRNGPVGASRTFFRIFGVVYASWLRSDSTTAMNQSLAWLPITPLMFGYTLGWRS